MRHRRLVIVTSIFVALIAGYWFWFRVSAADRMAIEARYVQWQTAVRERNWDHMYAMMASGYRADRGGTVFLMDRWSYGEAGFDLEPGWHASRRGSKVWVYPFAIGSFELLNGEEYEWARVDGQWYFTGEVRTYLD